MHDTYYEDIIYICIEERASPNFHHPPILNTDIMTDHIVIWNKANLSHMI